MVWPTSPLLWSPQAEARSDRGDPSVAESDKLDHVGARRAMCGLVATAVETMAVARFALCAVLAVVIELAVCLRLMFRRCDTDRCSCEGPPRSSSACVLLV